MEPKPDPRRDLRNVAYQASSFGLSLERMNRKAIRERRRHYETRIGEVYDILREGSAKARAAAAETLADVRAAMKINYFDDRELIDGQTEHFKLKTEN